MAHALGGRFADERQPSGWGRGQPAGHRGDAVHPASAEVDAGRRARQLHRAQQRHADGAVDVPGRHAGPPDGRDQRDETQTHDEAGQRAEPGAHRIGKYFERRRGDDRLALGGEGADAGTRTVEFGGEGVRREVGEPRGRARVLVADLHHHRDGVGAGHHGHLVGNQSGGLPADRRILRDGGRHLAVGEHRLGERGEHLGVDGELPRDDQRIGLVEGHGRRDQERSGGSSQDADRDHPSEMSQGPGQIAHRTRCFETHTDPRPSVHRRQ
jgi:hypothetical protein